MTVGPRRGSGRLGRRHATRRLFEGAVAAVVPESRVASAHIPGRKLSFSELLCDQGF